jgi:hypothetical protein
VFAKNNLFPPIPFHAVSHFSEAPTANRHKANLNNDISDPSSPNRIREEDYRTYSNQHDS